MPGNENIREDLFGERGLEPHLFTKNKVETVLKPDIWMTPELKEAAKALQNAWDISHDEQMSELKVHEVSLKFADQTRCAMFYNELVKLAKLVNPNFPSTFPLVKPNASESSNSVDGVWLHFWNKYFLPDVFDAMIQDVAGTALSIIPAQPEVLNQAKAFLNAYGVGYVRMDLEADEGADRSMVDALPAHYAQLTADS